MKKSITLHDNFKLPTIWRELRQKTSPKEIYIMIPAFGMSKVVNLTIGIPDTLYLDMYENNLSSKIVKPRYELCEEEFKEELTFYPNTITVKTSHDSISEMLDILIEHVDDGDWIMDYFKTSHEMLCRPKIHQLTDISYYWISETVSFHFKYQEDVNLVKILLSKTRS